MSDKKPAAITGIDTAKTAKQPDGTPAPMVPLPEGAMAPVCPHCGADPCNTTVLALTAENGSSQALIFCANPECRALFNVQILALPKQQAPQIATPGTAGWLG